MAFSVTIADATQIDPQSGVGGNGSGWVAIVVLAGLTSLVGTADASQLTLTVSDPGYDGTGSATTVVRTIKGVAHMRRQWPNGDSKLISTNGTDLTLYISLSGLIFSGSTVTAASITSSFYPGATSGAATTITNASVTAYKKPLFGWLLEQHRSCGNTFDVEAVAGYRYGRNGRMVACIEFSATDGTNTTASVFVSSTQLSANVQQGNRPEVYAATLDTSGLTNGAVCTVNAKVYPWIGDSGSVLDLNSVGVAWPTSLPQTKLRFLCDRTGAYGGAFAYVKVGASGGTVSATALTARADPFATISAALSAIQTWNNANRGHNDVGGGTIRLMDNNGMSAAHGIDNTSVTAGLTWCTVEPDPLQVAALKLYGNGVCQMPSFMRYRGNILVDTSLSGNWMFLGQDAGRDMLCIDGLKIDNTVGANIITWYGMQYVLNVSLLAGQVDIASSPSANTNIALLAGVVDANNGGWYDLQAKVMVGNVLPLYQVAIDANPTGDGDDGRMIINNRLQNADFAHTSGAVSMPAGLANIQNVYETVATGGAKCMNFFADGDMTTIDNYLDIHNTAVGERCSRMYNDQAAHGIGLYGIEKTGVSKYSVCDNWNCKSDTFNGGQGAPGNWGYTYGVDNDGDVCLYGSTGRGGNYPVSSNDGGGGSYLGNAWLPSSEPNLNYVALTQAQIMSSATFVKYTVQPQASPQGGGDYGLPPTATLLMNRVPAGMSTLKYDIAGRLRKTDGTGAAGAYEAMPVLYGTQGQFHPELNLNAWF